jgi:ubiquitin-protein ligase
VEKIIKEVDKDGSGEIEFGEFVDLMHKVATGAVEMGLLAQAIVDSGAAQKLAKEVKLIKEALAQGPPTPREQQGNAEDGLWSEDEGRAGEATDALAAATDSMWVEGLLSLEVERRDPTTCTASLLGPTGTPYQGRVMVLELKVGDDYPFAAPVRAAFTHRVLHVNFGIGLDGHTTMPQLLQFWDAEWGVAKLLRYILELLAEPNLALLPPDYAEGTRHDPSLRNVHAHGAVPADGAWPEEAPVVGPPAGDLRRRKGRNRFLAELVFLFCEQREKYDTAARDFSTRYAQLPPPPGHTQGGSY